MKAPLDKMHLGDGTSGQTRPDKRTQTNASKQTRSN